MLTYPFNDELIVTDYGKFFIRPRTADAVVVSPAYEYLDRRRLVEIVNDIIKSGKRLIFVDVGANIGCYSIYLGMKSSKINLTVLAVEASPLNYEIMIKNIKLNYLDDLIKAFNYALWDEDNIELEILHNEKVPGGSTVRINKGYVSTMLKSKTLNSLLKEYFNGEETLVIKIDVEGVEERILKGGKDYIEKFNEVYLLVESLNDERTISILREYGFKNFLRLTPYNLWAHRINENL